MNPGEPGRMPAGVPATPPFAVLVVTFVAVLGHACWWCGMPVGRWILPTALLLAAALRRPALPRFDGWLATVVATAGVLAIAYGSLATMDRSWDGFATWSLTARHLAAGADLEHPYFANPTVYHAVRGYPLLQPMLLQQASLWLGEVGGRVLFPLLWLWLLMAVRAPLVALGVPARLRLFTVAGIALVPLFTEPGHGSAESGFAELLLAVLLTHAAAAIVLRQPWLGFCIGLCLPLCKHEGAVHLMVLIAVATAAGVPRVGLALAGGGAAALCAWVPLQLRLGLQPPAPPLLVAGAALVPLVVFAWSRLLSARRTRLVALLLALAGAALAVGFADALPAALGQVVARVAHGLPPWKSCTDIVTSLAEHLVWMRKVGLSFVVLAWAAVLVMRRRRGSGAPPPLVAPLLVYVAVWFLLVVLFLLTLPADQLPLFLREGTGRYLSQILGVAWLGIGLLLRDGVVEDAAVTNVARRAL